MKNIFVIGIDTRPLIKHDEALILSCSMVAAGKRLLDRFQYLTEGKKTVVIDSNLSGIADKIEQELAKGSDHKVAVLATGDPLFYGIGKFILNRFTPEKVQIRPALSIIQEVFARIGKSWQDVVVISLHGRSLTELIPAVTQKKRLFLFTDPQNNPQKIASFLTERGFDEFECTIAENLGTKKEKITTADIKKVPLFEYSNLNVMIVEPAGKPGQSTPPADEVIFGAPENLYEHEKGMITKAETRALVLSKLMLKKKSILWDIGACSGSVSIEAATIARCGLVYAIEADKSRIGHLVSNKQKFNPQHNLKVIHGSAPACLELIKDDPDRVFIGGSNGMIKDILAVLRTRLRPKGRIVMAMVSPDSLKTAEEELAKNGFGFELSMAHITRTKYVKNTRILTPLTPTFIIEARQKTMTDSCPIITDNTDNQQG